MRIALLLVGLAACTDEVSIASGVCGNYVHETGEDCDRPGGACTSECRIVCDPGARGSACASADAIDGTCCPDTMICGVDDVCHAATGTVSSTVLDQSYSGQAFIVSDLNGDLIADLLDVATNTTEIRYGDATTPFATTVSVRSPTVAQTAEVGFGDFDGDKRNDVVLPTTGGLFAFTTTSGGLDPVQFPATVTPGIVHQRVAFIGNLAGLFQLFLHLDYVPNHNQGETNFQLTLWTAPTYGVQSFNAGTPQTSLCGLSDINADTVLRGRAIHPFNDGLTVRVPIAYGGTLVGICVATANPGTVGANPSYAIPKAVWGTGYRPSNGDGETFFANLVSASGCPDLVVSLVDTAMGDDFTMILKGVTGSAGCTVDMLPADAMFLPGKPLAAVTLSPFLAASQPGLITSIGVYGSFTTTPSIVTAATRPWHYAVVGDLDGDGRQDVVTVGANNDVEVFRQLVWLAGGTVEWSDYVIATANPVALVALGNFDGDKAGDVAIATIDTSSTTPVQDLAIAWGSVDGTFDLEDVGSFKDGHSFAALDLVDTSLPIGVDHNDDLLIARGGTKLTADDPALVIAVYGSTSRTLTAPYVMTAKFDHTNATRAVGIVAQVGAFGANQGPGVAALFAAPGADSATSNTDNTAAVTLTAQKYGGFDAPTAKTSTWCSQLPPGQFCVSNARYTTMHRSEGDLFLGLRSDGDSQSQCAVYFVATGAPFVLTPLSCSTLAPAAAASTDPDTQAAYMALTNVAIPRNLDSDGTTEHLALLDRTLHMAQAFRWELTVDGSGQPQLANPLAFNTELQQSGALPAGATASCMDVAAAELGTRDVAGTSYGDGKELVLACTITIGGVYDTQLWTRYAGPPGSPPYYTLLHDLQRDVVATMRIGDVNGDGLDDVVWSDGQLGRGKLHALMQCDAHQSDCRGGQ
jgi:hypothetical protein